MQTLLLKESPLISLSLLIGMLSTNGNISCISFVIMILLSIFYRFTPTDISVGDDVVVSPAEGLVTYLREIDGRIYISIYLDVFNKHTQIYPINGIVTKRIYDKTGEFNIVIDMDKSKNNEKKIHYMKTNIGNVKITQIAGFLPRRISSSDKINIHVSAGDYLGIIKFGSRVDLEFDGSMKDVKIKYLSKIKLGDIIYHPLKESGSN